MPYYVMVDSQTRQIEAYRLIDGVYQPLIAEPGSQVTFPIQLTGDCQIKLSTKDL